MDKKKSIIPEVKKYVNTILSSLEHVYYHQYAHSLDVFKRTTYLAKKEGLCDEDVEMLQIAALFHDTWFVIKYEKNEPIWAKIASNFLQSIGYPQEKIKKVERIILATDPNYTPPKDIFEEIIKDADIDNLGRNDFFEKWGKVKEELEEIKKIKISDPDWHHSMLDILYKTKFYTKTQIKERQKVKDINEKKLKKIVKKDKK